MDRAFWITWYDLPDAGRDEYLAWLHGAYLPAMLKRPGYLWGAHYASLERSAASVPGAARLVQSASTATRVQKVETGTCPSSR